LKKLLPIIGILLFSYTVHAGSLIANQSIITRLDGISDIGTRIYNDANQTISNNTATVLNFNQERYDNGGLHDTVTNNSRIIFTHPGKYDTWACAQFDTDSTGVRQIGIRLNGSDTALIAFEEDDPLTVSSAIVWCTDSTYEFAIADYIEVRVFQNSGGDLDIVNAALYSAEFGATYVQE